MRGRIGGSFCPVRRGEPYVLSGLWGREELIDVAQAVQVRTCVDTAIKTDVGTQSNCNNARTTAQVSFLRSTARRSIKRRFSICGSLLINEMQDEAFRLHNNCRY